MFISKQTQFILLFLPALIQSLNICGDWTQYKDIKCIKVLKKSCTEEEAMSSCSQLDQDSTLVSIHSNEEQDFLNNLLHEFNGISAYAWLAMKYTNGSYKWLDGTKTNYSNWAKDAIKDGTEPCVQISLVRANLGKWMDELCKRTALIVCQKKQVFTLNTLRQAVEAVENKMKILEISTVPLGFLYTQLPNQSAPFDLWPHWNWTEVTEEYAGLFFRAEGNNTLPFGQIQQANQSTISHINVQGFDKGEGYAHDPPKIISTKIGWNSFPSKYGLHTLGLYFTKADVRPVNTAVRIWKRTN